MEPQYLPLLSESDVALYNKLRESLSSRLCRNRRGHRLEHFNEMLDTIKQFAVRNDEDDWKRCLVCGVVWLSTGIAINTRQLRLLINKCKSSINGSLHRMGYSSFTSRGDTDSELIHKLPMLENNFAELRQWTVRKMGAQTPQPSVPVYEPKIAQPVAVSPSPSFGAYEPYYHEEPASFFDDQYSLPLIDWGEATDMKQREFDDMDAFESSLRTF